MSKGHTKPSKENITIPEPEVIKLFFMLNSAENEICSAYKKLNTNNLNFFSCKAEMSMKFVLPINIKMPTIGKILKLFPIVFS